MLSLQVSLTISLTQMTVTWGGGFSSYVKVLYSPILVLGAELGLLRRHCFFAISVFEHVSRSSAPKQIDHRRHELKQC